MVSLKSVEREAKDSALEFRVLFRCEEESVCVCEGGGGCPLSTEKIYCENEKK